MKDYFDLAYLKSGNSKQRIAYERISDLKLLSSFKGHEGLLVGALPLGMDSDKTITIIFSTDDLHEFKSAANKHFSMYDDYESHFVCDKGSVQAVVSFRSKPYYIVLKAEERPILMQRDYKLLEVESKILSIAGQVFKSQLVSLMEEGYTLETSIGKLLSFNEEPKANLVKLSSFPNDHLKTFIAERLSFGESIEP